VIKPLDIGEAEGILAIGDVHGCYDAAASLAEKALQNKLFPLFLGDLVGRGDRSANCMRLACDLVEAGLGGVIVGNHDRHFVDLFLSRRPPAGTANAVIAELRFRPDGSQIGQRFCDMIDAAPHWARYGNAFFVHAAFRIEMLHLESVRADREMIYFAEQGVHSGEVDENGCSIRLHNWVHDIPPGMDVFFGHDVLGARTPKLLVGAGGGCAYAMDTGGVFYGRLSGAVIRSGEQVQYLFSEVASPLVRSASKQQQTEKESVQ
jgi:hypothetical protein